MSIAQMTLAWRLNVSPTQKLVLLSLADNASDPGECYPSIAQIVSRTCLSERAVRQAIRALEDMGAIHSEKRRGTSTVYFLTLSEVIETQAPRHDVPPRGAGDAPQSDDPGNDTPAADAPQGGSTCPPAADAPRQQMPPTPAADAPPPRHDVPPRGAGDAPKPSLNHQLNRHGTVKPSSRASTKPGADRDTLLAMPLPDWLPMQSWADWVDHRLTVKSPMTERAADLALRHLDRLRKAGNDPVLVIEQSVRSGKWTDLYPLRDQQQRGAPAFGRQQRTEAEHQRFLQLTGGFLDDGRTIDAESP